MSMRVTMVLMLAFAVASCGRPQEATTNSAAKPSVEKKCPDPDIHDSSNPCSPNYYKPVQGGFKGEKGV